MIGSATPKASTRLRIVSRVAPTAPSRTSAWIRGGMVSLYLLPASTVSCAQPGAKRLKVFDRSSIGAPGGSVTTTELSPSRTTLWARAPPPAGGASNSGLKIFLSRKSFSIRLATVSVSSRSASAVCTCMTRNDPPRRSRPRLTLVRDLNRGFLMSLRSTKISATETTRTPTTISTR